jgi:hypothetical protein
MQLGAVHSKERAIQKLPMGKPELNSVLDENVRPVTEDKVGEELVRSLFICLP